MLTGKESRYTGDPINSTYPVHNATLHINGTPYHDQNRSFTCVITGVNTEFLQQYNVPDDNLSYIMTVYINANSSTLTASASSDVFSGGFVVGIIISVILILAIIVFVILVCYGKCRRSKTRKLSVEAPFKQLNVELAADLKSIDNNSKMQFPQEKIALLEQLG